VVSKYLCAIIALAAGFLAALNAYSAAPRADDPDWPCQQRLVPKLTAAAYWNGPALESIGDWRVDPASGQISKDGETARLEVRELSDKFIADYLDAE